MAKNAPEPEVVHALRAGAVDYLHKPVAEEELAHALQRARHRLPADLADVTGVRRSEYRVTMDSNPANIPGIISWLIRTTASTLPEIQRLHLRGALQELLFNAVEHGNLEIYYREKHKALEENRYEELLAQRLTDSRFKDRQVTIRVLYEKGAKSLSYCIVDEGKGFRWRSILDRAHEACSPDDANGRGIFLAQSFFPSLTYNDRGNEVSLTVSLG
jgi:anti-sigma regulatory factor (Ser/Thr protein kinase)